MIRNQLEVYLTGVHFYETLLLYYENIYVN